MFIDFRIILNRNSRNILYYFTLSDFGIKPEVLLRKKKPNTLPILMVSVHHNTKNFSSISTNAC